MIADIQKSTLAYLRNIFASLDEFKDYVFWIRNRDMSKQYYTSDNFKLIWERDVEIIFEIPLLWLDYLAPDNRLTYFKQLQARHEQGYLDSEKNITLYQVSTPTQKLRYLLDRCYRCVSVSKEHYIVGISKSISAESWSMQYENSPEALSEDDKNAHQQFFSLLKKEFGITPLNEKQSIIAEFTDKNDYLGEIHTFGLSKREFECLYHFCKGKTYKQTAKEMVISPRTVETYLENILSKTSCSSKIEIISRFSRAFSQI